MNDNVVKHLEFIQNVITRMNTNSFMIKGWMATLVSAVFALAAIDTDSRFLFVVFFAVPFFWILDGFYLSQERQYRALYDDVRKKPENTDFSMDAKPYNMERNRWARSIWSSTLMLMYIPVLALTIIIKTVILWS